MLDIFLRAGIDQVEQARKGIAQIEAAAAAVTDVEDAPHLGIELRRIGEIRILPVDDVAGGGVEAAFAGHAGSTVIPGRAPRLSSARGDKEAA